MKKFWDKRWYYRTIEEWTDTLLNLRLRPQYSRSNFDQEKATHLIFECIEKLVLEKKVTKDEAENLRSMLRSEDHENVNLAVILIARLKPRAFKKNVDKVS